MNNPVPFDPERGRRQPPPTGLPPHDVVAEEATLAALLLDDDALPRVQPIVRPEDFFREQNGWIYACALAIWMRGEEVTIPTVAHELDRAGKLDEAGGEPYLVELTAKYFTAVGVEAHARIVARDATYRRLIQACSQGANIAYEGGPDAQTAISEVVTLIEGVRPSAHNGRLLATIDEALDNLEPDGDDSQRVSSGFASIDRMTRGLKRGQVSVWGGRQDSGKSALMMSAAWRQAYNHGVPVLYVPFEDTVEDVLVRLAGGIVGMSWDTARKRVQSHMMSPAEWAEFRREWTGALGALRGSPLVLPEVGATPATWDDLLMLIRLAVLQHGVQVVWIDYLDVAPKPSRRGASTADLVSQQMADLQSLAIRSNVHIVAGSQVSNEGERDDQGKYPPKPHRLLDSGAKARVARLILMLALQSRNEALHNRRALMVAVDKVKGWARDSMVTVETASGRVPALYLDMLTGLVREVGE